MFTFAAHTVWKIKMEILLVNNNIQVILKSLIYINYFITLVSVESCEKRLNCHYHAQCVATGKPDPPALCQCRQGYEGNGTYCSDKGDIAIRLPTDNKVCSDQSDCHQFAACLLEGNTYYCRCLAGYRGDGHNSCIKSGNYYYFCLIIFDKLL